MEWKKRSAFIPFAPNKEHGDYWVNLCGRRLQEEVGLDLSDEDDFALVGELPKGTARKGMPIHSFLFLQVLCSPSEKPCPASSLCSFSILSASINAHNPHIRFLAQSFITSLLPSPLHPLTNHPENSHNQLAGFQLVRDARD